MVKIKRKSSTVICDLERKSHWFIFIDYILSIEIDNGFNPFRETLRTECILCMVWLAAPRSQQQILYTAEIEKIAIIYERLCVTHRWASQIKCAFRSKHNQIKSIVGKITNALDVCVYWNVNLFWRTHFTFVDICTHLCVGKDIPPRVCVHEHTHKCECCAAELRYCCCCCFTTLINSTHGTIKYQLLHCYCHLIHTQRERVTLRLKSPQFGFILADNKHK